LPVFLLLENAPWEDGLMTEISVGDKVTWNGYGTQMEGEVHSVEEATGKIILAHGDLSQWQAQRIGDACFAFSGTENGENTFRFPIEKLS
jgi:hypothetical protein